MRMKNKETIAAFKEKTSAKERVKGAARSAYALGMAASTFATAATATGVTAFAAHEDEAINQIVEIMKKVCKYVGIGLAIFGVYELAMAFLQQAPEQKTKGVLIIVVGAIMIGMGTFIDTIKGWS